MCTSLVSSRLAVSSSFLYHVPKKPLRSLSLSQRCHFLQTPMRGLHERPIHTAQRSSMSRTVTALFIGVIGFAGFSLYVSNEKGSNIRLSNQVNVSQYATSETLKILIKQLVSRGDKEAIQELIRLLDETDAFSNIRSLTQRDSCVEALFDALIQERNLSLIREIFPLFGICRLRRSEKYSEPIRNGDLELVQAMREGGLLFSKESHSSSTDMFLYAIYLKQYPIAAYLVESAGYVVHERYPFSVKKEEGAIHVELHSGTTSRISAAHLALISGSSKAFSMAF